MAQKTEARAIEGRAPKRCWNCQDRKIACDKTYPACLKCKQRGKVCEGYGMRLSWPKDDDAKRSAHGDRHFIQQQTVDSYEFVDATVQDIDLLQGRTVRLDNGVPSVDRHLMLGPAPLALAHLDPTFADGRSRVLDIFASAPDDMGDLYGLLVRMSLTDDSPPAMATRHALSALSYQSLGRKQSAYTHESMAIRALQASIETDTRLMQPSQYFQAMAASMLLGYYETLDDKGTPLNSAIYICGCKRIALTFHREHNDYQGDPALILDWVLYHDAMYKFSIHHWDKRMPQQEMVKNAPKIVSKPIFSPQRHVVNASIGCSLELLDTVCQIVDTVLSPLRAASAEGAEPSQSTPTPHPSPPSSTYHSLEHLRALRKVELRLENLKQHVSGISETSASGNDPAGYGGNSQRRLECEARLYHIAAQLYLQRLGRGVEKENKTVQNLLDEAFAILRTLGYCRRPWVLFVVGVEARDEDERHIVMRSMAPTRAGQQQPRNITLARRLIQAAWHQLDLLSLDASSNKGSLLHVYNTVISANEFPPLFA